MALVFIAAGLLSHAVHEFIEVGEFYGVELVGTQAAYDISAVLPDSEGLGQFLRALFGYADSPEILTLVAHVAYLVAVLALYLRPIWVSAPAAREAADPAPGETVRS